MLCATSVKNTNFLNGCNPEVKDTQGHSNFRENNTQALVISERLKLPQDDRTDTNFMGLLRMHFQRSKSTLDSLKSVFNVFRRKPLLGAPVFKAAFKTHPHKLKHGIVTPTTRQNRFDGLNHTITSVRVLSPRG